MNDLKYSAVLTNVYGAIASYCLGGVTGLGIFTAFTFVIQCIPDRRS